MQNIRIYCESMIPSKNVIPQIMINQYQFRQTGEYIGENEVGIALLEEAIWWNRPAVSDTFIKQEADGLYSFNFPYFSTPDFKTEYNSLLNVGCVPVAIQLKVTDTPNNLSETDIELIDYIESLPLDIVKKTLVDLGVESTLLTITGNDLLYNDKKFMGVETIVKNGWISINFMVTLFYTPEKSIFKRLTGKYALKRGITGIIEETNLFTREEFTNKLLDNIRAYLKKYYREN